jgi:capsular exopolysaccharide synthesis family protein
MQMNKTQIKLSGVEDFFIQEAYKVLRSNIQFCGQNMRVIAITSCHENEGKTSISLHLGKCFAELDKKVLIIDADMRKSVMVGRNSTSKDVKGLSELLTGLAEFDECIYETQYESLNIIFAGKYPPNPVELLSTTNFNELITSMKEKYDYIIIDLPPLGAVIDAAVVAPQCDGVALVVSDDNVRISVAKEVIAQLKTSKSKIIGVIRNNTNKKKGAYYRRGYSRYYTRYGGKYKATNSSNNSEAENKKSKK